MYKVEGKEEGEVWEKINYRIMVQREGLLKGRLKGRGQKEQEERRQEGRRGEKGGRGIGIGGQRQIDRDRQISYHVLHFLPPLRRAPPLVDDDEKTKRNG